MSEESCNKDNVDKEDLLRLLACLQSELEAREDVINTLRLEKLHAVNFRAKYGFGNIEKSNTGDCEDPFFALQRDSLVIPNNSSNAEADLKPFYDTQLVQLENLITSQRRAQDTMREQLMLMESKYLKVCKELEDERSKHERDAAQGDDVLVMLEKERERLKSEVEYERSLNRKLEKELRRVLQAMREQTVLLSRQKWAAISIIKERRRLSRDRKLNCEPGSDKPGGSEELANTPARYDSPDSIPKTSDDINYLSKECVRLQMLLTEEINARKVIQDRFERLQKEHESLLNISGKGESSTESSQPGFHKSPSDPLRTVSVDRSADPGSPITLGTAPAQRPKPNPPMRRSSEISNTSSLGSPTTPHAGTDPSFVNGSNVFEMTRHLDTGGQTDISSIDSSGVSPTVPLSVKVPSGTVATSPTSRSSTPSPPPPPPPPPIQLHYPYPGMQSHLHTTHSRNTNASSSFVPNTTRPLSGSMAHALSSKPRPALTTAHGSHPTNSPYPNPYVSPPGGPQIQANRMSFTPTSRVTGSRKPSTVITHSVHADVTPTFSTYPASQSSPFASSPQTKGTSVTTPSQFQSRSTNQHMTSSSSTGGSHHFPAYPALRQHSSSNSSGNSARAVRSSVPPASTALSSAGGPMGSGHVCINGK